MSEVTRILSAIEQGDPSAAEQLLPLVYDELRKLAGEKMAQQRHGQTLHATSPGTAADTSLRRRRRRCGASSSKTRGARIGKSAAAIVNVLISMRFNSP